MRHAILHDLGWTELRPVQELTIPLALEGCNLVVLAPTAQGKTEAAAFPVLSRLLDEPPRAVGALWVSPLRALLNNQEPRLTALGEMMGMRAFKWHGDVPAPRRQAFLREPAEVLLITPESLEGILMNPRVDEGSLFQDLRCVVIDEVHAFAGDDRGDHLAALLERLPGDFQRIGLSATVGNPELLLTWLAGSSARPGQVVRPEGGKSRRKVEIHPAESLEERAALAARLARDRKSLCFTPSRNRVEGLRELLEEQGIRTFVHHGSLSRAVREDTEEAFREGGSACIVCTSTLELGLDIGDLDLVLQVDAPSTVSSLLQRWGRVGRRPGSVAHLAFLVDQEWSFLRAVALVRLAARGAVEDVRPSRRAAHIFLHQTLARVVARGGLTRRSLLAGEGHPYPFLDLDAQRRSALIDHLVTTRVLSEADSLLILGPEGEKVFGRANFLALYSVFETPRELHVRTVENQPVGTLEVWFAQALGEAFCFALGGRAWMTVAVDWDRGLLTVKPAPRGRVPTWRGNPVLLGRPLCHEIRALLTEKAGVAFLNERAGRLLADLRGRWSGLLRGSELVLERQGKTRTLWTFAGGRINQVLALALKELGLAAAPDNLSVTWPDRDVEWAALVERLRTARPSPGLLGRGRLSKFQPFLPPELEREFLEERLLDVDGAREVLQSGLRVVQLAQPRRSSRLHRR